MSSLPKSVQDARKAYAGGTQQYKASGPPSTSPQYSKAHLFRTRPSSPVAGAVNELNASSPPSSPLEKSELARARSDTPGSDLKASSSPQSPEPQEGWAADYLPSGFKILSISCYNYEPFEPPPLPPVLPCLRAGLYSQIVTTSRPAFLS